MGSPHPVKAVLEVILRAAGFPAGADLRPSLAALWLAEQGILDQVRSKLGSDFGSALRAFLMEERLSAAVLQIKPSLAPNVETMMGRLTSQFEHEPEPTVELLVEVAQKALVEGRREIPLTLIILDEVQQFIREDPNVSLVISAITEQLTSKFKGRLLLVCTGQSALSDTAYLERLLGRFSVPIPLTSAHIDAVIRKTVLLKKDTAKGDVEKMLDARSGEIDKHLQGSSLARSEADRAQAVADWPILAPRRRVWERVLAELDKSGLSGNLRGQLRLTLEAVQRYADRPLGTAVATDFLFDTFRAEALISQPDLSRYPRPHRYIKDTRRQRADQGPHSHRRLPAVAHCQGHTGSWCPPNARDYRRPANRGFERGSLGSRNRTDVTRGATNRSFSHGSKRRMAASNKGKFRMARGFWCRRGARLGRCQCHCPTARFGSPTRHRRSSRIGARVQQGASKTNRRIERVIGDEKPSGDGLTLRIWNGWDHGLPTVLTEVKGAAVTKDATLHLLIPDHRSTELRPAITAFRAATAVIQQQGVPTTDGGKDAKAAMELKRDSAESNAKLILKEAVDAARVYVAGGNEVGAGLKRSDAVRDAGLQMLDRLFPDFGPGDSANGRRRWPMPRSEFPML